MTQDVVIVGGARTPMAEYSGTPGFGKLKELSAIDLCAHASKAALERSKVPAASIDHTVIGNALQTSNDAIYGARHVALKAGVPHHVPALTVNRLCGSGIQSIATAAEYIQLGRARTVLAGGMENMSQAPYVLHGARDGYRFGVQPQLQDLLFASLYDPYGETYMAQTAERIATRLGITREQQDEYALRSHQLGAEAVRSGRARRATQSSTRTTTSSPTRRSRRSVGSARRSARTARSLRATPAASSTAQRRSS
jgi:acetyl-CoA acyltransferase 2